jgi:very-short-patch-repair endonuclease
VIRDTSSATRAPPRVTLRRMPQPATERRLRPRIGAKLDARRDARVAALAGEELGVLSVAELRACGLSKRDLEVRRARGFLHPLYRGVYAVGHTALTREATFLAAVKACGPGAFLSHFAAAVVWGFVEWEDRRYPEVTVTGQGTRRHPGIRVHRTALLAGRDVSVRGGVPLTTPARTLADLAAHLPEARLRRAVRQALSLRRVNLRQLSEVLIRLGPRRGSRKLRRIVAGQPAPTKSMLEDVVLDLVLAAGFEHPDVNRRIRVGDRWLEPDLRWPEQRLIIEADGGQWHDDPIARADDAERQALLEASGERVLRVTWQQATANARQTIRRIEAAGAPR